MVVCSVDVGARGFSRARAGFDKKTCREGQADAGSGKQGLATFKGGWGRSAPLFPVGLAVPLAKPACWSQLGGPHAACSLAAH